MNSWIRTSLFFTVFVLIVGGLIAVPVIENTQAKDMLIQMETTALLEAPMAMEQGCNSCIDNEKMEHCSNLCISNTTAIYEDKSFELTKIPSTPPFVTLISMFEYIPSVEPTPPRT
ncbi:MAG: hypothetical protein V7776_19180 [Halopseudomonas aestusnigri]